jgi:tryptophan-rich sensory protein
VGQPVTPDDPHDRARTRAHRWSALAGFVVVTGAAAAVGAAVGPVRGSTGRWYDRLDKPPFQPPPAAFGPVWSVLYATIAWSGWRVWQQPDSSGRQIALGLWSAQMATNAAWTPLFFGARRPRLALVDLVAQLASTVAYAATARRVDRAAAVAVAPYLGWTAFAGVLNAEIVRRND